MKFIDLFAGLGGFNLALKKLGHECVFASEIDPTLRDLYKANFGIEPVGDIREVRISEIPDHDILCAGFPCQPFSKAGAQDGFEHEELGDLYRYILEVVKVHHPSYLILENVPNLEKHDNGETWKRIRALLKQEKYDISTTNLSPDGFGIPQIRQRLYIVASTNGLADFLWPRPVSPEEGFSVRDILDKSPSDGRSISDQVKMCLDIWQEFLDYMPKDEKIPHPLWSMEFGATYPYETTVPGRLPLGELRQVKGAHGISLASAKTLEEALKLLPSHARPTKRTPNQETFPNWKIGFIRKNREFYIRHKSWLDKWIPKIEKFPSSLQKLEWNCQSDTTRVIRNYIIQIRPSGVRVKRATAAPSLVAMTATQVPIIGWEERYMTPTECKRLQSMEELQLPKQATKAYEALGNAVNVEVARRVAEALLSKPRSPQAPIPDTASLATCEPLTVGQDS